MARRRARILTDEERALWRAFASSVQPLPGHALPPAPAPAVPTEPAPVPPPAAASAMPTRGKAPLPARPPSVQVGQMPSGLDRNRWRDLHRGRTRPERTLDLHGRRAQDAYHAVRSFLLSAHADGLRCVAVVTGKGPMPEGGVLRREFPHWLNAPDLRALVLGAAYPHAANQGAVHLLLRRRRQP
ncbi:Smr/MutS family protein [Roseomonas marmotae]|uniref:Smr/MutS family protein n=1 Tax=Roseomonas marmotae TaxID=2768161 RepID=A0ABS3K6N8_9PROT|nr:Smr/MutS family protein [Roseomonas marmotae]MBO1073119.1 Smr/MutS family protein [Roseomonas marmotae]QTI79243.1 Smr/MutS family protein [Roseomonas marmotae]